MNPCHIYWNDIDRTNDITIHNEEEINFVSDCIYKLYKQLLNLIKKNIRNKLLHPQLEVDYYNIINNYHRENISYELHKMTTEKYNLDLAINPKIIEILEIMRQKVYEYESLKPKKDPEITFK